MESLQKSCIVLKAALNLWNLHSGQQILQFLIYQSKHEVTLAFLKFQKKENEEFGFISLALSRWMLDQLLQYPNFPSWIQLKSLINLILVNPDSGKLRSSSEALRSDIFEPWENICGYKDIIQANSNFPPWLILSTKSESLVITLQVN